MRGWSAVVVGAGGAIGSHVISHLGRLPGLARAMLIDRDVYEERNLAGQDITRADLGRGKALVQARHLLRIRPALTVEALPLAVEQVPLGRLKADVLLACVDTRRTRQYLNEAAVHLGIPWIDAGVALVEHGTLLARVTVYAPGHDLPCLECAWGEAEYQQLEQAYPCAGDPVRAHATGAPSALGALAAALQILECQALLAGERERAGREVLLDASHHACHVSRFRRQPGCRLTDHGPWRIEALPARPQELTLAVLLERARASARGDAPLGLRVEGQRLARGSRCASCGHVEPRLRFEHAGGLPGTSCARCGTPTITTGFDRADWLALAELSAAERAQSLAALGIRAGDVVAVAGPAGCWRFEIAGNAP